jgi:hypothetical protein
MFNARPFVVPAFFAVFVTFYPPVLALAGNAPSTRTLDVTSFGARGDGKTDDTVAVQKAIDACKAGDALLFPEGRFLVRSVVLKPGVHYLGKEAVIARPDHQPGWTRTFTTSYSSDEDSALTTLEGLTFDGNRKNQGPYTKYEQGQSHLVFLAADPAHKGRVRALVKNCHFRECVADGLSVYTNVDVQAQDCSSYNCFRGGFVLTGGNTKAAVKGFTSDGTEHSVGFDIEVDGAGYGKTLRIELTMERLRLKDGHFDIAVGDASKVEVRDAVSRSGFCLCASNSTVKISDCDLGVGRFTDAWNRIVFPGKTTFERCRFTLRPELNEPTPAPKKWAAIHIYWNISGTSYRDQRLEFTDCKFDVDDQVGPEDITYGIYAERDGPLNNSLSLCDCTFSDRFQKEIEMLGGAPQTSNKKAVPPIRCEGVYPMHLQGICTDEKSLFWSFTDALVKTEMGGRIRKKVAVANHHGDLCYHDGKVYVAVNLGKFNDPRGNADSWVYVYDAENLREVARHKVPEVVYGAGGIGYHGDRFVVVGGLPPGIKENYAYEYDKDFKFIRKQTIQSGYTLMGIQTVAYSGGFWWFGCYGKPEILLKTDASFRLVGKYEFNGSLGIVGRADGRFLVARGRSLPGKGHTASVVVAEADPQKGLVIRQSGLTPPQPTK